MSEKLKKLNRDSVKTIALIPMFIGHLSAYLLENKIIGTSLLQTFLASIQTVRMYREKGVARSPSIAALVLGDDGVGARAAAAGADGSGFKIVQNNQSVTLAAVGQAQCNSRILIAEVCQRNGKPLMARSN